MSVLAGCGLTNESAHEQLATLQDEVLSHTREVVAVLQGAGLEISRAAGAAETCQSEPAAGLTYRAGGSIAGTSDQAPNQFVVARRALLDDGWKVDTEGMDHSRPWANLSRDDYRLGLSQAKHGDRLLGFSIRTKDSCIPTDDDLLDDDLRRVDIVGVRPRPRS